MSLVLAQSQSMIRRREIQHTSAERIREEACHAVSGPRSTRERSRMRSQYNARKIVAYQSLSSLQLIRARRLAHCQRLDNVAVPLSRRPNLTRVRPVENCPQFLIRVLDRGTGKPEPSKTMELMICNGDFGRFILHAVNFIYNDAAPW